MNNPKGIIFDIKKFAIHDGPGIRTTVFLKGCPMNCIWCHNPESKKITKEIKFIEKKCRLCGNCVDTCPEGCFLITDAGHFYNRAKCLKCGCCVSTCFNKALEMVGWKTSPTEIIKEVIKDKNYFLNSKGGITLSGGEPLMQAEFSCAILKIAKKHSLHTCVETAGFTVFDKFELIIPYTDIFLYDLKETDPEKHKEYTGVDNKLILENIYRLDKSGSKTILRCPIIPGLNDNKNHFAKIAEIANNLNNIMEINILGFHSYGASKSSQINEEYKMEDIPSTSESALAVYISAVQKDTDVPVKKD